MNTFTPERTLFRHATSVDTKSAHSESCVELASKKAWLDTIANGVSALLALGIPLCFACYGWQYLYRILLRVSDMY